MENYDILMHKSLEILPIQIDPTIGMIQEAGEILNKAHLPVGVAETNNKLDRASLNQWWVGRSIPASRMGLDSVLESLGETQTTAIAYKAFGLSLSDHYWVKPWGSDLKWEEINFFSHDFSEDIGELLLGKRANIEEIDFLSPDNITDGWLKKRWKIINGKRCLIKSGSSATQQEPYNEAIATAFCQRLGFDHIPYDVILEDDEPYSVCENFVDIDSEFIPAWRIFQSKKKENHHSNYQHYLICAKESGYPVEIIRNALDQMLILDYLIRNEDRHFGNFGILRNPDTLEFRKPAPIFDSGSSLWFETSTEMMKSSPKDKSKPFKGRQEEQIRLVSSFQSFHSEKLEGIEEEIQKIIYNAPSISKQRLDVICREAQKRIQRLEEIANSERTEDTSHGDLLENVAYSGTD